MRRVAFLALRNLAGLHATHGQQPARALALFRQAVELGRDVGGALGDSSLWEAYGNAVGLGTWSTGGWLHNNLLFGINQSIHACIFEAIKDTHSLLPPAPSQQLQCYVADSVYLVFSRPQLTLLWDLERASWFCQQEPCSRYKSTVQIRRGTGDVPAMLQLLNLLVA